MNGRPRVLPVSYAIHEAAVWTAVDNKPKRPGREPARVRWLREHPHAALTVDRYDDDWPELRWVQLIGEIAVLDGPPLRARSGGEHRDPNRWPVPIAHSQVDRAARVPPAL